MVYFVQRGPFLLARSHIQMLPPVYMKYTAQGEKPNAIPVKRLLPRAVYFHTNELALL